jgi:hypothetical protein
VVRVSDVSEVTVAPAVLTFTPSAWAVPQMVVVSPLNNSRQDGDHTLSVTIASTSVDTEFNGIDEVVVTVQDADICRTCGRNFSDPIVITSLPVQLKGDSTDFPNNYFHSCPGPWK